MTTNTTTLLFNFLRLSTEVVVKEYFTRKKAHKDHLSTFQVPHGFIGTAGSQLLKVLCVPAQSAIRASNARCDVMPRLQGLPSQPAHRSCVRPWHLALLRF